MANKVCWVDEDERIWSPERKVLLGLGLDVVTFNNASDAFDVLSNHEPNDYRLLILDVMLRQGEDLKVFSDTRTQLGLDTGIVLANELISCSKDWAPKILLFSRANRLEHVKRIRKAADDLKVKYLRKEKANQGRYFVKRLEEYSFIEEN